jgi:DNA-binding transcriptional LysR family regulator
MQFASLGSSPNQECAMPVPIETRHIEAILALAEELSFTRAATRLRLGQPSLSRQIEQLEGIVGFPICDRSSRHVIFTEAGQELVDEFRRAAQHIKLGIHRGQVAHEGKEHILLIGHSPYVDPHLLSLLFEIRLPQFPKFRIENLALVSNPTQMETVLCSFLSKAPLHAVMPDHHSAAIKASVSLSDFAEDSWIVFQESAHPVLYRTLMQGARSMGISIRELHHILTPQEVIHMVSTGVGISFMTQALARIVHASGIVCRSLAHEQLVLHTHTAIRRGDDSKLVNAFVRAYHRKHAEVAASMPSLFQL